ncbi:hypothetical protein [Pseudosporangium ferrugineum]|uniref:Uncharacterized protein n=1 Tax=Pseudosporangium ferrugineum TaxID=439699 RepID=A0A2T0RSC1_9ACTN|nr:hypothetical protein [Pseudosporangium ferrugineum]PRY24000.1 hypothetical protein CLV70_114133 [Pseudosporangium ferrugineum]
MKRKPLAVVAVVVLLGALGVFAVTSSFDGGLKLPSLGPECTVRADGEVTLDAVQMANAATISAVGMRREMSERAIVVALATAFQESKLENLDDGDRDSVGLFQQRPSKGWGTVEQIKDPRYAANRFYSALKRVKGWKKMRVTDAAQKVQRSAYPNAYEKWADEAEVLVRALTGQATGAVECSVDDDPALRGPAAAQALAKAFALDWDVEADRLADLTVSVKDVNSGWRYAHWLVAHAESTGLERVRFADREWSAPDGKWQPVTGDRRIGNHEVAVEVFR